MKMSNWVRVLPSKSYFRFCKCTKFVPHLQEIKEKTKLQCEKTIVRLARPRAYKSVINATIMNLHLT